jgi:hypothetical protein
MARSRLTDTNLDLITDAGAILWSMVYGEQLEFPITLNFIVDASVKPTSTANYNYEAVVIEAKNVAGQTDKPTLIQPSGVTTRLFVRLPVLLGAWDPSQAYNKEEVVLYSGAYYKLLSGVARTSAITPDKDTNWGATVLNKIYVQFPSTLGSTWTTKPLADSASYGFFELRVTEPVDPVFTRTFKPVRGMVELLFSPTNDTTDVLNQTV